MDAVEFVITDKYRDPREKAVKVHDREHLQLEARIALSLAERWAMIAAVPDGETSTGHRQFRLMEPHEIAPRACKTAKLLAAEIRDRGWVTVLPSLAELNAAKDVTAA